jgi:hypothetical protein
VARRHSYPVPTADRAERNLERWFRKKRVALALKKKVAVQGTQPLTANRSQTH